MGPFLCFLAPDCFYYSNRPNDQTRAVSKTKQLSNNSKGSSSFSEAHVLKKTCPKMTKQEFNTIILISTKIVMTSHGISNVQLYLRMVDLLQIFLLIALEYTLRLLLNF